MKISFKEENSRNYLLVIIMLGFLSRVVRVFVNKDIKEDAVLYMNMARTWTESGVDAATSLHTMIPPLWPWTLHIMHTLGVEPEITGKIVGVILGTGLILAVYVMCRTIFTEKSYALIGALLVSIHPYLIRLSTQMLRDTVYIPLVAIAIAIAMSSSINQKWWKWGAFGFVSALGAMTRREGAEILIFLLCWSLVELIQNRKEFKKTIKEIFTANIIAFSVFFAIIIPVQTAMSETRTTWRFIPKEIGKNVKQLFSISDDELLKKLEQ